MRKKYSSDSFKLKCFSHCLYTVTLYQFGKPWANTNDRFIALFFGSRVLDSRVGNVVKGREVERGRVAS